VKTCPDCNGDGVIERGTDDEEQCPTCGGNGLVPNDNDDKNNEEIIRSSARGAASTAKRRCSHASARTPGLSACGST
jgi:DnaJ-class molecular chaperone